MAKSIVLKDVQSPERLLDETALFLHRVVTDLPAEKQAMLERLHGSKEVLRGRKVLVVDDDARNIFALTSLLENHEMEVISATNGRQAIDIIKNTPDLSIVLMDIMMPEMDGYETMREIRNVPKFRTLPILALTAKAMKGDREKCLDAGASDYIAKPVNTDQLLSLMRVWLYPIRRCKNERHSLMKMPMIAPVHRPTRDRRPTSTSTAILRALTDTPINILIVDDEPKNLTVLETILDDPGYRLVRAESADQALLALVVEEFALLILDIRMPGMTGFELAKMIKERKKTARVPIIFLTAYYNEDQHVLEGYGTGAVDYLHKPVNPDILRSKVAVFAELHRKSREVEMANRALLAEVAERRRAEEQLRELNETLEQRVVERTEALRENDRRKDEFLATLAHELRNPLAPVRNAVQVLHMKGPADPESQWAREVIDRQVQQMTRLIDDLMDVSRISRGKIELRRERIELANVVLGAVETSRPLIDEQGHELTLTMPPDPVIVDADEVRLTQVFMNLLTNAAKYSEKGSRIDLHRGAAGQRRGGVGEGRRHRHPRREPADHLRDVLPGRGGIVPVAGRARHRPVPGETAGRNARRQDRGQERRAGQRQRVRGPPADCRGADPPRTRPATTAPTKPTSDLRILVVDDNRDAASILAMLLKIMGNHVRTAHDGEEAVQAAGEFRPHVVLLDIGLPKMNGYEAARAIRQEPWGKNMILIAVTGWGQDEDKRKSEEAGFDRHMVKPVDPQVLMKLLAELDISKTPLSRQAMKQG